MFEKQIANGLGRRGIRISAPRNSRHRGSVLLQPGSLSGIHKFGGKDNGGNSSY
jgi:hypothetical protein